MRDNVEAMLRDKMVRMLAAFSFVSLIIHIFVVALFYPNLPPYVPFFNSMPWGEARLIPSVLVLSVPIMILTVFIMNFSISIQFYNKLPLIVRILQFNTALFIFLSFLAYVQIIFLVY